MTVLGLSARYHAYQALNSWQQNKISFIQEYYDSLKIVLLPADYALSREIALGVVRYRLLYETVIRKHLKGKKQASELLTILSIAAHQIFVLERIPDHAIGACCVELAQEIHRPHLKAVVNAVIRKLIELRDPDVTVPRINPKMMPNDMSKAYSFPAIFVSEMQKTYKQSWRNILDQLNVIAPICLRRQKDTADFTSEHVVRTEGCWSWWSDPRAALQYVQDGKAVVQDFSQSHVASLAHIQPGETVLDVCAAPGGKANAASECSQFVVAADIQVKKVREMSGPFQRLVQDAEQPAIAAQSFDVVIADVPCSNSGVFARRPEARWRYANKNLMSLCALQKNILQHSANLVAPGGRLIYSTCSISPNENQGQVHSLDGWKIVKDSTTLPDEWQAGAYAALLQRC
ncbi:MAG: hypothetical protein HRU15_02225 [Planctomycetes bacterium]|nr:hypothetical protein [Planctomycetota bacterium]